MTDEPDVYPESVDGLDVETRLSVLEKRMKYVHARQNEHFVDTHVRLDRMGGEIHGVNESLKNVSEILTVISKLVERAVEMAERAEAKSKEHGETISEHKEDFEKHKKEFKRANNSKSAFVAIGAAVGTAAVNALKEWWK